MRTRLWLVAAVLAAGVALPGCTPLVVGAAGVVVVDEVLEQEQGGDGLF